MKKKAISGKDIMLFFKVDGAVRALALATNHTLNLTMDTNETSSKDSGKWADHEGVKWRWDASSENFIEGLSGDYALLVEAWRAGEAIDVTLAVPTNIDEGEVPADGWLPPSESGGYTGKALITNVNLVAQNDQNATMSITLLGKGSLDALAA